MSIRRSAAKVREMRRSAFGQEQSAVKSYSLVAIRLIEEFHGRPVLDASVQVRVTDEMLYVHMSLRASSRWVFRAIPRCGAWQASDATVVYVQGSQSSCCSTPCGYGRVARAAPYPEKKLSDYNSAP